MSLFFWQKTAKHNTALLHNMENLLLLVHMQIYIYQIRQWSA